MKRTLQILTHKGMINGEFICRRAGLPTDRQVYLPTGRQQSVTAKK